MDLFRFVPGYSEQVYEANEGPLLFTFVSFLIAFALVRLYTRLARTRGRGSGSVGVFVVLVAIAGAIRLAKPGSPWARWFYDPGRGSARFRAWRERRRARSERRCTAGWSGRFERWFSDLVGGAPTVGAPKTKGGQAP